MARKQKQKQARIQQRSVCVDFDATLAWYTKWEGPEVIGKPIRGARQFLMKLRARGIHIIIYSCRAVDGGKVAMEMWLEKHRMPYDHIDVGYGKPHADAYIDDKGVTCRPQEDEDAYETALSWVDYLCGF